MFNSNELATIYNALVKYKGESVELTEKHNGKEIKVTDLIEKVKTIGLELLEDKKEN